MPMVRKQKGGESWPSSAPLSWPLSGSQLGGGREEHIIRLNKRKKTETHLFPNCKVENHMTSKSESPLSFRLNYNISSV